MTNEIKEKLDNLKIYAGREESGFICDIEDCITNLQEENKKLKWERDSYYEDIICYIKNTMHVSDKKARKTFDEVSEDWSSSTIYHTLCELDEGDE